MTKKKKTKYNLYAFNNTEESVELATKYRFARITSDYTLVYTDKLGIIEDSVCQPYIIIKESETGCLTAEDKDWLLNCNIVIIAEEAAKNKELILRGMSDTIKKLEKALETEKNNLSDVDK